MTSICAPVLLDELNPSLPLAIYIQKQRHVLQLTIEQAAHLSGLQFSEWCALEAGWTPGVLNIMRSIAGTLEASTTTIVLLADTQRQVKEA